MDYNEIEGDLIVLAEAGTFDVIVHGCNCFCRMKRGIAPQMAEAFGCDCYQMELGGVGNINKLGQIDYRGFNLKDGVLIPTYPASKDEYPLETNLYVVNAYTQYQWSTETKPFDYDAFTLCMRKMNHIFKGKHIGMPMIGSHLAGGDWNFIQPIIEEELYDCRVTVVKYKP